MKKLIAFPLFFLFYFAFTQNGIKVYPSSWWVGMKNPHLAGNGAWEKYFKRQILFFEKR